MSRIKIADLPKDQKITKEEMRKVIGGASPQLGSLLSERNKISKSWWSSIMNAPSTDLGGDPLDPTFGGFDPGMGQY